MEMGERRSKPAITLRKNAQSATLRATGPAALRVNHPSPLGGLGTRPGEVRSPTTLQKLGGFRSEPPMSLPSASGTMPHARATEPPPVLPPQVLVKTSRIESWPENWIECLGAEAPFRHVGLADNNGSGIFFAFHDEAIEIGYVVFVKRRTKSGADALRRMQILHADRKAVQWPFDIAFCGSLVRGESLRHQLLYRNQRDNRVDLGIYPLDLFQVGLHHFARRELFLTDEIRHLPRRQETDVRVRSGGHVHIFGNAWQRLVWFHGSGLHRACKKRAECRRCGGCGAKFERVTSRDSIGHVEPQLEMTGTGTATREPATHARSRLRRNS